MANPRETFSWNGIHAENTTFPVDATIVPPVIGANGLVPNISPQVGLVCALVNTGTASPLVGLGASGNPVLGVIQVVDPADGVATVQDQGYAYVPYNLTTVPTVGNPVECDGTGKVQLSASNKSGVICVGFGVEPNPRLAAADGLLRCIIKLH